MPDTQITELAGRHYLISQLLAGGVEVALPARDKGIDLIAYLDRTNQGQGFLACPLQLKANQQARFGLHVGSPIMSAARVAPACCTS